MICWRHFGDGCIIEDEGSRTIMRTVLVTGGAGFIGSALCGRLLSGGIRVVAFDNFYGNSHGYVDKLLQNQYFEMVKVDVNNHDIVERFFRKYKFDTIYHLAANTSISRGQNDINIDIQNTFLSTISILQMAVKYKIMKFVFTSSSTIYGVSDTAFDEASSMYPISYYGAAKMSCEAFISAFCSRYGIKTWIIRFCNVVGPNITHGIISDIKKKIKAKQVVLHLLGNGKQEKPFLYIDDAIDGLLYVENHAQEKYNIYLIGNKDSLTVKRIAEIALEVTHTDAQILFDNTPSWSGDVYQYKYNIKKVLELGWKPKYNSEEAIRKSFR